MGKTNDLAFYICLGGVSAGLMLNFDSCLLKILVFILVFSIGSHCYQAINKKIREV